MRLVDDNYAKMTLESAGCMEDVGVVAPQQVMFMSLCFLVDDFEISSSVKAGTNKIGVFPHFVAWLHDSVVFAHKSNLS